VAYRLAPLEGVSSLQLVLSRAFSGNCRDNNQHSLLGCAWSVALLCSCPSPTAVLLQCYKRVMSCVLRHTRPSGKRHASCPVGGQGHKGRRRTGDPAAGGGRRSARGGGTNGGGGPAARTCASVVGISMEPPVVGRDWSPVSSNKARGCCCQTSCRPPSPIAAGACSPAVFTHTWYIASRPPEVRCRTGAGAAGASYASHRSDSCPITALCDLLAC
jgi:hypothetical protein